MSDPFEVEKNVLRSFKVGIQEGRRAHRSVTTVSGKDIPALARHPRAVTRGESLGRKLPKTDRPTRETRLVNSGKRDRYLAKSDPFELGKSAQHMDPAPATARLAGAVPKHSAEAQAVAQAAATKRRPPVGAAIRGTLRATTIAKAEDPFQPTVMAKSAFGERGDKRNTKYAAAGYAGATIGSVAGRRAGAKAAGTSMRGIYTQAAGHHLAAAEMGIPPERGALRSGFKALKGAHGARSMLVGDGIGSVAGAAAGAAAVHRRRARRGVTKSAFGVEHPESVEKKKIPAVLPGQKLPPRGFEPKRLPARSVRDASGRGAQGQRRTVRSGKV